MNSKINSTYKKVDLHLHTNYSDGKFTPYELLRKAKSKGLNCVGIVDHDNVDGIEQAIKIGKQLDIEVIPGVELSTTIGDLDVHILGYFIDHKNKTLLEYLKFFKEERLKRAKRIVDKLNTLKIPLNIESVLERSQNAAVGRPHIANAMVEEGFVENYRDAFYRYIKNGGPAYEKKIDFSADQAISLINQASGLSFIAHPGGFLEERTIYNLINLGIDGIETIHPNHNQEKIDYYRKIINEYFLLECGGSDYHGGLRNDDDSLGKYLIPYKTVTEMKQRLFK